MHGIELLFSTRQFGHHPEMNGAYDLELIRISSVTLVQHQTRL